MKVFEGKFNGQGVKIAIVAARFNEFITSKLIGGAEDILRRHEGNKGADAAMTAIEMINLIKGI